MAWSGSSARPISRAMARVNKPSAHPDPAVHAPAVDRHARLRQRLLPGEDVRVHGVDQRPVEIEDQCAHATSVVLNAYTLLRVVPAPDRLRAPKVHAAKPAIDAASYDTIGVTAENRTAGVGQGDRAGRQLARCARRHVEQRRVTVVADPRASPPARTTVGDVERRLVLVHQRKAFPISMGRAVPGSTRGARFATAVARPRIVFEVAPERRGKKRQRGRVRPEQRVERSGLSARKAPHARAAKSDCASVMAPRVEERAELAGVSSPSPLKRG